MNERINYRVYVKKAKEIVLHEPYNSSGISRYFENGGIFSNTGENNDNVISSQFRSKDYIKVDNSHFYEFLYLNSNKWIRVNVYEYDQNKNYKSYKNCVVKSAAIKSDSNSPCDVGFIDVEGRDVVGKHVTDYAIRYTPSNNIKYIRVVFRPYLRNKIDFQFDKYIILKNTYPTIIHDSNSPDYGDHLLQPKLHLEDSSPGNFEFVLSPINKYYANKINLFTDTIYITRSYKGKSDYNSNNERIIWDGRAISEETDIYGNVLYHCEGALAYLNDIRTINYNIRNIKTTIGLFIQDHLLSRQCEKSFLNNRMDRTFFNQLSNGTYIQKIVTNFSDEEYKSTYTFNQSYENPLKFINDVKDAFGFHYKIRYRAYNTPSDDIICRSFTIIKNLKTFTNDDRKKYFSSLHAEFGENIFDCKKSSEVSSFATAIIPRGKECETTQGENTNVFLTSTSGVFNGEQKNLLSSPSLRDNDDYIRDYDLIKKYGYIEAVVDFEDVWRPSTLKKKANAWFANEKKELIKKNIEITLSNLKLNLIKPLYKDPYTDDEYIDIWTMVEASIPQLGITKDDPEIYFVSAMDIPLDDYLNTSVTLINKRSLITDKKINAGNVMGASKGVMDSDNN